MVPVEEVMMVVKPHNPRVVIEKQQPANGGRTVAVTNGSVINNGGNAKFGLYPTVGVSIGFLNMLASCCKGDATGKGVGINTNPNSFLM